MPSSASARPPKRLKVGWLDFEVVHDPAHLADTGAEAVMSSVKAQIIINRDQPRRILAQHLLHEVLHACVEASCFDSSGQIPDGVEERLVQLISPLLLSTLRENPGLVRFLLD